MIFDPATHTLHAAGRTWQADPAGTNVADLEGGEAAAVFGGRRYLHRDRRCIVRFESGWSVSIVWGSHSYSSNYEHMYADEPFAEQPRLVECGVLDHTGELRMRHRSDGEMEWHDVESYVDDDALAALLDEVAALPTDYDFGQRPPTMDELHETYAQYRDVARANGHDVPDWPGA